MKSANASLRRLLLSPSFSEFFSENGSVDMMDEDAISNLSVRVKISLTVWDFILPTTPSLPAVFGVSLHSQNLNKLCIHDINGLLSCKLVFTLLKLIVL